MHRRKKVDEKSCVTPAGTSNELDVENEWEENKTHTHIDHDNTKKRKEFVCVVCVFFPFILDIKFVGRSSRSHTGGRSHRISHPPSFCGACLNFSREKDSAIPFPRQP